MDNNYRLTCLFKIKMNFNEIRRVISLKDSNFLFFFHNTYTVYLPHPLVLAFSVVINTLVSTSRPFIDFDLVSPYSGTPIYIFSLDLTLSKKKKERQYHTDYNPESPSECESCSSLSFTFQSFITPISQRVELSNDSVVLWVGQVAAIFLDVNIFGCPKVLLSKNVDTKELRGRTCCAETALQHTPHLDVSTF